MRSAPSTGRRPSGSKSLLLRTAGVETAAKLAAHEIPWTDPAVKTALKKYAEMLKAGCCGDPEAMFANDWDEAADQIFKADASNYLLIGMWVNARARNDYGLKEGVDYSLLPVPRAGHGSRRHLERRRQGAERHDQRRQPGRG